MSGLFSALCTVDIGGAIAYMSQASEQRQQESFLMFCGLFVGVQDFKF